MEEQKSQDARDIVEKLQRVDCIMHRKLRRQLNLKEKPGYVMILSKLLKTAKASPEGFRISDLASAFDVTASSVTQMVTGLEERGLVGRNMDSEDRRAVRVSLTEEGRLLAASMIDSIDSLFSGLVDYLGHDKSREFLELLSEVAHYFDSLTVQDSQNSCERAEKQ